MLTDGCFFNNYNHPISGTLRLPYFEHRHYLKHTFKMQFIRIRLFIALFKCLQGTSNMGHLLDHPTMLRSVQSVY